VESLQRNRITWPRPAHEKGNVPGPPACAVSAWSSSIFAPAVTVACLKLAGGPATSARGMNCPRTAGGETRQGGQGPRQVPALERRCMRKPRG
jgi:hypothetical protein